MHLTAQAAQARRAYFSGANPTERRLALFDAWERAVGESRGIHASATGDDLEINCLDVIGYDWWTGGGITGKAFKKVLDEHPKARQIRVVINSPGGIIDDGMAIYSALRRHPARIITECLGMAASSASVVFSAGDERQMNIGTQLMIHRAWGFTMGNAEDHAAQVKALESYDESILNVYVERAMGGDRKAIAKLVAAETYLSADEAVELGFADVVLKRPFQANPKESKTPEPERTEHGHEARRTQKVAQQRPLIPSPMAQTIRR